ncbi:MAG: hypothetical protein COB66_06480 [Coxiella sp. (in: Bacteria)]|nr:MAG: hypothetical protein COB66_06480 [Coxiella sp. (in: g-proteobacteria)]
MSKHEVIPGWIHGLEEYEQMFDLKPEDFKKSILDFPGSISSFNAEVHAEAKHVVSGDAIYAKDMTEMQAYADKLFALNSEYLTQHADDLLQKGKDGLEFVFEMWQRNQARFLEDYAAAKGQGRYERVLMPNLPYETHQFQLALCSDYVFNGHAHNDCRPEQVVLELCRVAEEVRIFPLLTETGDISEWLGPIMLELQNNNYGVEVRQVSFENLKGGNAMMRAWAVECTVE